ncbi:MAG: hypothetical protein LIO75_06815, partial [Lachnospiraceae bacterium]|nr:hypothetical protein [Lachnospiraceae bacterium]
MIQDLAPLHFDNTYYDVQPRDRDRIIALRDAKILIRGNLSAIDLPRFEELTKSLPFPPADRFTYLFAIGGERFFLCRNPEPDDYRYVDGTTQSEAPYCCDEDGYR